MTVFLVVSRLRIAQYLCHIKNTLQSVSQQWLCYSRWASSSEAAEFESRSDVPAGGVRTGRHLKSVRSCVVFKLVRNSRDMNYQTRTTYTSYPWHVIPIPNGTVRSSCGPFSGQCIAL
jgi:hypothetical protein